MKRMSVHARNILKFAVLAGLLSLPLVGTMPQVQAETGITDEFSQRVRDEMSSDSTFMRELRQYVSAAKNAYDTAGTPYSAFATAHAGDYPELARVPENKTLNNVSDALQHDGDAQNAIAWGVMGKVSEDVASDPRFDNLRTSLDTAVGGTSGQFSILGGRIQAGNTNTFGDASISGNQTIDGSQTIGGSQVIAGSQVIGGNSRIEGNQTVDGELRVRGGIDAGDKRITTVGDGEVSPTSKDAVNGRQLYRVTQRYNRLNNRVNRIGAGAAALAALQPLPYNPGQRWSVSTGYGHYRNANASALGAYYYPNENIMVSFGSVVGNGENMLNAGVSVRLGPSGEKVKNTVIASEVEDLKALVQEQGKRIEALEKQNALLMEKLDQKA